MQVYNPWEHHVWQRDTDRTHSQVYGPQGDLFSETLPFEFPRTQFGETGGSISDAVDEGSSS